MCEPQTTRTFEVARIYRFKKGSGLPLRIPVIEMVEIGAGGGSIARVDQLQADHGRAGQRRRRAGPGLLRPRRHGADRDRCRSSCSAASIRGRFAGGAMALDAGRGRGAPSRREVGDAARPRSASTAAFGVSEIVDENMANAARVHAIESGKDAAATAP